MSVTDRATRKIRNIADSVTDMNTRFWQGVDTMRTLGTAITGVTAMLVQAFQQAVPPAAEYEQNLVRLNAVAYKLDTTFSEWSETVYDLADKMPVSVQNIADAMYTVASAGARTEEEILAVAKAGLEMSLVHGVDARQALITLVPVLKAFDYELTEAREAANVMNEAISSSLLTVNTLQDTLKYVAPVAGTMGQSLEDVTSVIMAMAEQGLRGSKAGTAIRAMLTRLGAPTAATRKIMHELNLEFFTLSPAAMNTRSALYGVYEEITRLEEQIESTEDSINELNDAMTEMSIQQRKARLVISKIRFRADREDRELTADELERIERLELANEALGLSEDKLSIQHAELAFVRDRAKRSLEDNKELQQDLQELLEAQRGTMLPLVQIVEQTAYAFRELSDAQRLSYLKTMIGLRGMQGFTAVLDAVESGAAISSDALKHMSLTEVELAAATRGSTSTLGSFYNMLLKSNQGIQTTDAMMQIVNDHYIINRELVRGQNEILAEAIGKQFENQQAMANTVAAMNKWQKTIMKISSTILGLINKLGGLKAIMVFMVVGPMLLFTASFIYSVRAIKSFILWVGKKLVVALASTTTDYYAATTGIAAHTGATTANTAAVSANSLALSTKLKVAIGAAIVGIGNLTSAVMSHIAALHLKIFALGEAIAAHAVHLGQMIVEAVRAKIAAAAEIAHSVALIAKTKGLWAATAALWGYVAGTLASHAATIIMIGAALAAAAAIAVIVSKIREQSKVMNEAARTSARVYGHSIILDSIRATHKRAIPLLDELNKKAMEIGQTTAVAREGMAVGIPATELTTPGYTGTTVIEGITININTGPISGIEDVEEIGDTISEMIVERIKRSR